MEASVWVSEEMEFSGRRMLGKWNSVEEEC